MKQRTLNLKDDIWQIWKIHIDCKENYLFAQYLFKPKTPQETNYIKSSFHLRFLRESLWKLSIIELNKLFSNSNHDEFSIRLLIKNIRNGNYIDHNIPWQISERWDSLIKNSNSTINKIHKIRNKIYAHTDRDQTEVEKNFSYEEINQLLNVTEEIIKDVYFYYLDSGTDLGSLLFGRQKFDLLKILVEARERRIQEIMNFGKA